MDEDIIKYKIEKAIELICLLYKADIITDALITGSVAKGTARKESDIDIYLVNPDFINAADLPPSRTILPYSPSEKEEKIELLRSQIVDILKSIGVEFKELHIKEFPLWYQLYKGELFHLMTRDRINPFMEGIEITKDLCVD
jgi:predicted nucleotidyltransferase